MITQSKMFVSVFQLNDIPNGDYIFRFHSVTHSKNMVCNGSSIAKAIMQVSSINYYHKLLNYD